MLIYAYTGKASDFSVPAAAQGAAAQRGDGQPPARQEPGELGSKAQLEAALVAAVLHLLSLLPAGGGAAKGASTQLPRLQGLVQQARWELLLPAEQSAEEDGAAPGGGGRAAVYFDLSQVSPQLAAAAAEGLALL